nr:hypothetical protein [Tanacetum cinerariifolium]
SDGRRVSGVDADFAGAVDVHQGHAHFPGLPGDRLPFLVSIVLLAIGVVLSFRMKPQNKFEYVKPASPQTANATPAPIVTDRRCAKRPQPSGRAGFRSEPEGPRSGLSDPAEDPAPTRGGGRRLEDRLEIPDRADSRLAPAPRLPVPVHRHAGPQLVRAGRS